ncbi:cytochrome p450 [Moniliophthora roreri MCA 2997]|uniref:Cytochrome p450 n=1 Tax=Moniliophthora roreri (strain MCA 2997) TaxID=1381753 RepID=V2WBA7_MONRO|nr:cytochrome p450 [Moniliophthora roreri MCA 2997]
MATFASPIPVFPPTVNLAKDFYNNQPRLTLLALFVVSVLVIRQAFGRRKGPLPPGPKGLPIVGNLFQLSQEAWHTFTDWKKTYGDIVYINVAGQDIVVLNSHKVAADLLDRRAPIYSNRPRWIVASEILTGGLLVVFTQYNDVWRRMRRAGHEGLNKTVAASFQVPQYREAISLVDGMAKRPDLWNAEIRRATASMVWSVVYDKEPITDVMDPQVAAVNDFITRIVRAAFPGAHYVEYFTWMKHLPSWMAKWKRDAEEWYKRDSEMFESLFYEAKQRVKSGEDRPSFAANLVRDTERHGLSDRESAWLAATLYAAGAETTAGVLSWFMLAMVLYPEVQQKIHDELDAVVGRDRMPNFADLDRLHYVRATVREALRWHPVDPVGLPHQSVEDDWYEGHFIPKGTICIPNVWALNRDVEAYGADAADFNPGRFLDKDGKIMPALTDTKEEGTLAFSGHVTYGFGRRLCIGRHVANNSLFIDIACLLWATKIRTVKDEQGKDVVPIESRAINDGLVVRPIPFDCDITFRFPEAESILAQTKELVEGER